MKKYADNIRPGAAEILKIRLRGNPTCLSVANEVDDPEATIRCEAKVPSGASSTMASYEACELRADRDWTRYSGKGVRTAMANVEREIARG